MKYFFLMLVKLDLLIESHDISELIYSICLVQKLLIAFLSVEYLVFAIFFLFFQRLIIEGVAHSGMKR